jgi:hypothetical protein
MTRLYIAAAYLLLMLLTGLLASFTHGGKPRRLLDEAALFLFTHGRNDQQLE